MRAVLALALLATTLFIETPAHAGGIKNSQTILGGTLTRAGNAGRAQLSDSQLEDLCEKGYTNAYFLYSGAQARTVRCKAGQISYRSQTINDLSPILQDIHEGFNGGGKTFVHCNNGAHASGLLAAVALRQFCGYGADQAFAYWEKTLGGYPLQEPNKSGIRRRISNASTPSSMLLTGSAKDRYCK